MRRLSRILTWFPCSASNKNTCPDPYRPGSRIFYCHKSRNHILLDPGRICVWPELIHRIAHFYEMSSPIFPCNRAEMPEMSPGHSRPFRKRETGFFTSPRERRRTGALGQASPRSAGSKIPLPAAIAVLVGKFGGVSKKPWTDRVHGINRNGYRMHTHSGSGRDGTHSAMYLTYPSPAWKASQ